MIDLKRLEKSLSEEKFQELQALLANAPQTFLEAATVAKIPKGTAFIEAGEKDVGTMLKQIRVMMNRLNDQSSKERTFMFLSGQERLMYLLVRIYHEHAKDGECQVRMTQEELANQSGINLRTATRAIYRLCEEEMLTKKNRKLFISKSQCRKMEEQLKVIVDGGCNDDGEEENNFRL